MKESTFLIFIDKNDIYNFATFKCDRNKLHSILIEEGFYGPEDNMTDFDWVIFEDGVMIKG
jgi:hypothetical protein